MNNIYQVNGKSTFESAPESNSTELEPIPHDTQLKTVIIDAENGFDRYNDEDVILVTHKCIGDGEYIGRQIRHKLRINHVEGDDKARNARIFLGMYIKKAGGELLKNAQDGIAPTDKILKSCLIGIDCTIVVAVMKNSDDPADKGINYVSGLSFEYDGTQPQLQPQPQDKRKKDKKKKNKGNKENKENNKESTTTTSADFNDDIPF